MKFQVRLPISGSISSSRELSRIAQLAEELGFDAVQAVDRNVWTRSQSRLYHISGSAESIEARDTPDVLEPMTTLAYVAAVTKKVKLVTSVVVLPLRHPIVFAKETSALDNLSSGRLILGIGVGGVNFARELFSMVGIDYDERGTIADEYIKAIKAIWTQPSASFDGRYVKFRDAEIFPKPMQKPHPPIWIAGDTRRAMRRVAELGDGWHPTYASPQTLAEGIAAIENLMDRYHHRKRLDYGTVDYCCVSKLSDDAGEIARRTLTALGGGKVHPEYFQTLEKSKQRNLIGSVQEVSRLVDAYERAGATYLGLKFIYRSIEEAVEMMELFSREIISSH